MNRQTTVPLFWGRPPLYIERMTSASIYTLGTHLGLRKQFSTHLPNNWLSRLPSRHLSDLHTKGEKQKKKKKGRRKKTKMRKKNV